MKSYINRSMATLSNKTEEGKISPIDPGEASLTLLNDVTSYLPRCDGRRIIIIGNSARLSASEVAARAAQVISIDPGELHYHSSTIRLRNFPSVPEGDSRKTMVAENSGDLLIYDHRVSLINEEQKHFLKRSLSWVREHGYVCFLQTTNPGKENSVQQSTDTLCRITSATYNGTQPEEVFGLDLILIRHISGPFTQRENEADRKMMWLFQKVKRKVNTDMTFTTLQEILNNQLYTKVRIRQLESIFGRTFVSAGGLTATKQFLKKLCLRPGMKVLDVGCGIGGNAIYMAKEFGVKVIAMDLSSNMIDIARERAKELDVSESDVDFEVADATKREYPEDYFDVIFSRDTILHIAGKLQLFQKFKTFLKPGGQVLVSDYCCSEGEHTQQFKDYVKTFGYSILSQREYCATLEEAGFVQIDTENKTDLFIKTTTQELDRLVSRRQEYIEEFSLEDYEAFSTMWSNTRKCAAVGDQILGLFYAENPK
ncbi:phosphoethanolamine N-methyltransferase-like isoform X2 [Argopecten irradians]|uniref:phosphoethanolamine N-methyltransferase-like isoform X2 n=1 Tax=Argopecten irradians TaxID=31199 RepID=UPI00371397B8